MLGQNKTEPTGTAALPMDIHFIHSDLASFKASLPLGAGRLQARLSYADVAHLMDNFR